MGKIIMTFFIFSFATINCQKLSKSLVKITNKDSVQFISKQNNYYIKFYYVDKIKFNKKQKKQKLTDGSIYCTNCLNDNYSISVKPVKINSCGFEIISVDNFLKKRNGYADFFMYKEKYYKYNGRIIN